MLSRAVEQGFDVPAGVVIPPDAPVAAEDIARILGAARFAVRSSAPDEDTSTSSMAGRYCTLLEVDAAGLDAAIEAVRRGFGAGSTPGHRIPSLRYRYSSRSWWTRRSPESASPSTR